MSDFSDRFRGEMSELGLVKSKVYDNEERDKLLEMLKEGKPLPTGYIQDKTNENVFYKALGKGAEDLSAEEMLLLMQLRQAKDLNTIKKCNLFFAALAAASLLSSIITIIVLANLLA